MKEFKNYFKYILGYESIKYTYVSGFFMCPKKNTLLVIFNLDTKFFNSISDSKTLTVLPVNLLQE